MMNRTQRSSSPTARPVLASQTLHTKGVLRSQSSRCIARGDLCDDLSGHFHNHTVQYGKSRCETRMQVEMCTATSLDRRRSCWELSGRRCSVGSA